MENVFDDMLKIEGSPCRDIDSWQVMYLACLGETKEGSRWPLPLLPGS
jgi:hypothetical protein